MLAVKGLSKAYRQHQALNAVDLDVASGEIVALLGRNGAGKTTLVSIVAGLLSADCGSVVIGGIDAMADSRRTRAHVGLAPQETGVYPTLSCRDNLQLFTGLSGMGRRESRLAIEELAELLGLTGLLDRRAKEMSGGERRRLHTAIALVGRPSLVMLDEPTVGADVQTRFQLLRVVRDLARQGAAIVYSTHYFPEVAELEASVAILERGHILARGTADEVVAEHSVGTVDLVFAGPAPDLSHLPLCTKATTSGSRIQIETTDTAAVTSVVLTNLDMHEVVLSGLSVSQPNLEHAFLHLTDGYTAGPIEEVVGVA